MTVDVKQEADNLRRGIALFVAMGVSLPHEAHDMLEVFERCLKAEAELARLRESLKQEQTTEPITGEWLETIGFEQRRTPMGNVYWQNGLLTFYRGVEFCSCPLPHIRTREQMAEAIRVLLSSL